jgi:hypothetical protein
VTIEFKPDGPGTLLTLTHEYFFDEGARDRHNGGWNAALDKLESYLACGASSCRSPGRTDTSIGTH